MDTINFKTNAKNHYSYSRNLKEILLMHPLLNHIHSMTKEGVDLQQWLEETEEEGLSIAAYGHFTHEQAVYYNNFYKLLCSKGYFDKVDYKEKFGGRLSPEVIKKQLANALQITFEVTDACNLKCEYCGYGKFYDNYDKRENTYLSVNRAKRLLDYMASCLNSSLNSSHGSQVDIGFYGGEPLLGFNFIKEVVEYSKKLDLKHNSFHFSMTTNALLLEKHMGFLVENDFRLLISLDGDKKNTSFRVFHNGENAYDRIYHNVIQLREKYPDYFKNRVNFNAVLHSRNSVAGIYEYFNKEFDKQPNISELSIDGINPGKQDEFWRVYKNQYQDFRQSENYSEMDKQMFINSPDTRALSDLIHSVNPGAFNNFQELIYPKPTKGLIPTGTCLPLSRKIFLTANGKILTCERIDQKYTLGHVTEDEVIINLQEIADTYNGYYDKIKKQCAVCHRADKCSQCIFLLDLENASVKCHGFSSAGEIERELSSDLSYFEGRPGLYHKIMREVIVK